MDEEKRLLFGIDLGTTYSCISFMRDDGRVEVCQSMEGENTVPSVVRFLQGEEPVAGRTAKDAAVIYPDYTMQFVKSYIGEVATLEYGSEGDKHTISPEEVSAEVLKKLAKDAGEYTATTVKDVVITVPAYFGAVRKDATKKAGELAGLNVINIVEEPTAAAFYYGCEKSEKEEIVCIFDLGGGTFDVTAMKIGNNKYEALTTAGNHDLGGKLWDAELINIVEEKFRAETGYSEVFESDILQELQNKCEVAKKQLSSATSVSIPISIDRSNRANVQVTREEFDNRTEFLLSTAIDLTKEVFERVEEKGLKIDKILLVGGSTFMPQVRERLDKEFGLPLEINEPNEAVSKGACIFAAWSVLNIIEPKSNPTDTVTVSEPVTIGGDEVTDVTQGDDGTKVITLGDGRTMKVPMLPGGKITITTIANKSYAIRVLVNDEPKAANLIIKDATLPINIVRNFGLHYDGMVNCELVLYESEIYDEIYELEDGCEIGSAVLNGIPETSQKGELIELTISMDITGMLNVTGKYNGIELEGCLQHSCDTGEK